MSMPSVCVWLGAAVGGKWTGRLFLGLSAHAAEHRAWQGRCEALTAASSGPPLPPALASPAQPRPNSLLQQLFSLATLGRQHTVLHTTGSLQTPPPLSQPHLTLAGGRHCQQHAGMRQHQAAGRLHRHRPAPGAVGSAGQALGQAASSERPVPRCALSRRHGTQCGPWLPAFYAIAHWRHIEGATSSLKHGTALTLRPPTPAAPGPAGTLSSYCYVLMCIHLLQTRPVPVLPVLQQLPPTFRRTVGQWTCEFCDDVSGSCTAACGGATAWQE